MRKRLPTRQKFFLRRAAIFFFSMMIPTLLVIGVSMRFSYNRLEREIGQQGRQTIDAVEMQCQLIISNVFTQNDLLTGTTRMSMALKRTLFGTSALYSDAIFLSSFGSSLKSVVNTHDYIDSIYLYLDGAPRCFTSSQGITTLSVFEDVDWLDGYHAMDAESDKTYFLRRGEYGQNVLTFLKRTLLQKGCVAVNVNIDNLRQMLGKLVGVSGETLTLLDQEGHIIVQVGNEGRSQPTSEDCRLIYQAAMDTNMNGQWFSGEQERFYTSVGSYEELFILSTVDRPFLYQRIRQDLRTLWWVVALSVVIVLLLAYATTRRSFQQIGYMLALFENAQKGLPVRKPEKRVHDEYDVVMNNILYMYLTQSQLQGELQRQRFEREHSELRALQLQINPHFLYNTLQTLEMEVRGGVGSPADQGELVRKLSEILRYALGGPHDSVPLREEIEHLKKYAAVQAYRFGDRFVIYYEIDEELDAVPVFRLMFQPIVENCFLHGFKDVSGRLYISVSAERRGERIRFDVSDTGAGMTQEQIEALYLTLRNPESRSIGLTNLNRRLVLYYGPESALQIIAAPGKGTTVRFEIPIQKALDTADD